MFETFSYSLATFNRALYRLFEPLTLVSFEVLTL